ncbi:MAG TPA: S8 family serine peptidase, partial [Roseiflexaceae bacterium]
AARGLNYRPLWIVNAVLVHGSEADARLLAGRADVALVRANRVSALPPDMQIGPNAASDPCSPDQPGNPICWNIRQIGADRVWRDFGITGQGIVVANIDTGVRYDHPALASRYRGYLGPGAYDHNHNWFDPAGIQAAPVDPNNHGTHTMGTIVATSDGTTSQPAVGVAPGARWIAAKGCTTYSCNEADLIAAAQWLLAPTNFDGSEPRPDLRPMVINNSWAGSSSDDWYAGYTAAWRAAGIFPVFAAGNSGSACGSIQSPGDYPNVVGIGATDQNDAIASFSARGPTVDGRRKPDFVAPGSYSGGAGILSTISGGGATYRSMQGTSMATPHAAALVVLLWSANPTLIGDYDATYALIRDTARGLSDTHCDDPVGEPNNVYGYGRIDAYAAVLHARVDVPWLSTFGSQQTIAANGTASLDVTADARKVPGPGVYNARIQIYGADLTQPPMTMMISMNVTPLSQQATVTGRVVSADTGAPVAATVGVKDGVGVPTDSGGVFSLTLAPGTYDLVASAPSFLPEQLSIAPSADMRTPDIVMRPDQPHILVDTAPISASLAIGKPQSIAIPIDNTGTRPLYYRARVLPDQFAAFRSDEAGGPAYSWKDLPPDAAQLTLNDQSFKDNVPLGIEFPFYGYVMTETLVTSNGMLAFSTPNGTFAGPSSSCLPDTDLLFYEIAPFRADLDPARGGAVRYGTVDRGTTFVLSYEHVPLHTGPAGATYTFQVLLHNDGRITFQYRSLAALPPVLAVGVQRTFLDYQQLGCGVSTPIRDGLAIELQSQLDATGWLHITVADGVVLASSPQTITGTLDWTYPGPGPRRARIEIASNDPIRSTIVLPASVDMQPAPYNLWISLPRTLVW